VLAAAEELRTRPSAVVIPLRVERANDPEDTPENGDRRNHR